MKRYTRREILKSVAILAIALFTAGDVARATTPGLPLFYTTGRGYPGIDLGYAGASKEWGIFTTSGTATITDTLGGSSPSNQTVVGNVGVYGGSISISGNAFINGKGIVGSGGTLIRSGLAKLVGSGTVATPSNTLEPQNAANNAIVNQAKADATTASLNAASRATEVSAVQSGGVQWVAPTTINTSSNITLNDTMLGQHIVLNLTDFILTGGAVFSLTGTDQTSLVINVSGTLSLSAGTISLIGINPGNVLFNVTGLGSNVTFSSGAQLDGIVLAPGRQVNMSGGSVLRGTLIASKTNIASSRVLQPAWVSP